jgi:hypothetical protein
MLSESGAAQIRWLRRHKGRTGRLLLDKTIQKRENAQVNVISPLFTAWVTSWKVRVPFPIQASMSAMQCTLIALLTACTYISQGITKGT